MISNAGSTYLRMEDEKPPAQPVKKRSFFFGRKGSGAELTPGSKNRKLAIHFNTMEEVCVN